MVTLKTNGQTAPGGGWKRQRDWSPNSFNSGSQDAQDDDLARAIAASLGKPTGQKLSATSSFLGSFLKDNTKETKSDGHPACKCRTCTLSNFAVSCRPFALIMQFRVDI